MVAVRRRIRTRTLRSCPNGVECPREASDERPCIPNLWRFDPPAVGRGLGNRGHLPPRFTVPFRQVAAFRLQVSQSRVVGNYSAEHDNGDEKLELRADGTYVHHYRNGIAPVQTEGTWEFRRRPFARPLVLLHEFTPHFPRHDGPTRLWSLEVEEDFGMIRLYVDRTPPRDIYVGAPDPSYNQ